jgi:hypothetical protein
MLKAVLDKAYCILDQSKAAEKEAHSSTVRLAGRRHRFEVWILCPACKRICCK